MAKYTSNRQKNLKVGIVSYSENLTSLEVIGRVGIGTTNAGGRSLYVVGNSQITGLTTLGSANVLTDLDTYNLDVSGSGVFYSSPPGSSGLKIRNPSNTNEYTIYGSEISGSYVLNLPIITSDTGIAVTGFPQTFVGMQTFGSGITISGGGFQFNSATNNFIVASQTTGTIFLGGVSQTGAQTYDQSTVTHTTNYSAGASGVGTVKTINFGTAGLSSSFTRINIGPTSGIGTILINAGTNLGINSTTPTSKLDVVGDVKISGVTTIGSLSIDAVQVISSGRQLQNITSLDATTTSTIESAIANAPNTFTDLQVTGISTLGVTSTTSLTAQQLNVSGVGTFTSSGLKIRNPANTFEYTIAGSAIAADRILTLPVVTSNTGIAVTGLNQTFTGTQTFNSATVTDTFNHTGATGTLANNGAVAATANVAIGTLAAGVSKTVNLGTNGVSGSFTQINIGPTAGIGTVVINSGTNLGISSATPTSALDVIGDAKVSGVITATTFIGALTGIAASATKLETPRTFEITGDIVASPISFDGTGNVSLAATIQPNSVGLGTDTTGNYVSSITNGSYITGGDGGSEGSVLTIGVAATSLNTANQVVARDSSGNFSAGTITANLTGTASTASFATTAFNLTDAANITTGTINSARLTGTYNIDISGNAATSDYADIAGIATYASTAGVATALQNARTFEITGDIVASPISFDGTGNVSLAATIQPNSVALGGDTTGDYVQTVTGTANQITVTGGTGEGSTPTLSIPNQFTAPQDVTVTRDLQVNRNLNVNGNITIGGTTATIFSQTLNIYDPDIILGYRTDSSGNDISNDNTANHGGVALASTEGTPLVQLFIAGIETNPATYKKIMWFKAGTFSGLGTDAWLSNYAVGIGSTQFPTGTRLAAGSVQFTENDLAVVRNINASGITTTNNLNVTGVGTFLSSGLKIRNPANTFDYTITGGAITADRTLNLPVITGTDTLATLGLSQTFSGTQTFSAISASGIISFTGSSVQITPAGSGGTFTLGNTAGTGNIILGQSTASQTTNIQAGASGVGTTKTINLGTGGLSGSFTQINIGPTAGVGTVAINAGTNLGIGSVTPTSALDVIGDAKFTGIVTASSFSGNASSATYASTAGVATALQNSRTFEITGDIIASPISFNGTGNVSLAATIQPNSVGLGTDTTGNYVASVTNGSYITGADGGSEGATLTIGVAATSANTTNQVVARDSSGNFSAGTITANLTGTASTASFATTAYTLTDAANITTGTINSSRLTGTYNIDISGNAATSDYADIAGIATYASNAGIATYASNAGIATYASNAGVSTYATTAGIATYATNAGISTYATTAGIATYASNAGIATYADSAGIATYATTAGITTYATTAGVSTSVSGGTGSLTQLQVTGISTFTNGPVLIGSGTSTGTASQLLQVTGGAYVSDSVGIGITNTSYPLEITLSADATSPNIRINPSTSTRSSTIGFLNSSSSNFYTGLLNSVGAAAGGTITGLTPYAAIVGNGPGTTPLLLLTNALERVRITDTGLVGIGTTNPTAKLHVSGGDIRVESINPQLFLKETDITNTPEWGLTADSGNFSVRLNNTAPYALRISTNATNNAIDSLALTHSGSYPVLVGSISSTGTANQTLQVSSGGAYVSGNVGIGTTNPDGTLDVFGNISVGDNTTNPGRIARKNTDSHLILGNGGGVIGGAQTTGANIELYGSTHATAASRAFYDALNHNFRSSDAPVVTYASISTSTSYFNNVVQIGSATSTGTASQRLQVDGGAYVSGNLGIGTTNPSQTLHVQGSSRVTGARYDSSNSAGTSGQILQSTGSGTQWTNAAPANAITGLTIRDEGTIVGTASSFSQLNFVGNIVSVAGTGPSGIATITFLDYVSNAGIATYATSSGIATYATTAGIATYATTAGIATYATTAGVSTSVIGGIGSITQLQVIGISTFTNGPVLIGSGTSTGTASQLLQVTGGAYVSGNLGIGTTNPTETGLSVLGKVLINQDSGSNNRLIFRGQPGSSYRWNIDNYGSSNEFRIFREDDATSANGFAPFSISTTGTLTATKFSGDGSLLTNLPGSSGTNYWLQTSAGISTLSNVGIGTTNPTAVLTVSGNASITGILTVDQLYTSNNGNGTNVRIGDDAWLGDINVANTIRLSGAQDNTKGFIVFGNSDAVALGRTGTGPLYYGGNFTVAGVVTASSFTGNATSATYATSSGIATYASNAGISTYATTAGIATYATTAGIATYATTAGVSTSVSGGTGSLTQLQVTGISTFTNGPVFIGSGTSTGTVSQRLQVTGGAYISTSTGIGTTNPTQLLHVQGNSRVTGARYDSSNSAGTSGQILQSTGSGTQWTNAAPANAITGLTIRDEGTVVSTANSFSQLNFVGNIVSVAGTGPSGIATITFLDYVSNAGIATYATSSGIATYATTAGIATALQNARNFSITGNFVTATAISFDGTGNVSLAATITPDSIGLGTYTTGDYVRSISGTANQITVTSGTGEGSTPTLSIPNQFTAPQDVTVTRDLQVNRNLNVNGNITIGGTSATIFSQTLNIYDPDIVLGYRTDSSGNDISNDNTANHGGVAIASTEGTPLVQLFIAGIETNPATYKKIMWFKAGTFSGLGTDAWLSNYAVGIGSTQFPTGTRLAAGSVQFTENDLAVVRNINASGITTTNNLNVTGVGTFLSSGLKIRNPANTFGYTITGGAIAADRTLNLPVITGIDTVAVLGLSQTFSGIQTFNNGVTVLNGLTVSTGAFDHSGSFNFSVTGQLSSTITFGGALGTGNIILGQSTASQTTNIQAGASGVGTTKTINFGTGGLSGSFTQINIGPTAGVGTVTINSGTNLGIGSARPTSKLDVVGDAKVSGVVTATSFSGNATSATYATNAGIATYATNAGVSTYATSSGIATFATTAGVSTSVSGGTGSLTQLQVTGISTFTNGPVLIGSGTSTGTASQRLQVTGGAYVSGNIGVAVTSPSFAVDVSGDARVQSTGKMRFGGTAGTTNFYIQYNSTTNSLDFVAG